ncbi:hypothetical protein [Cupriavidus plantarum]|uniref:hypothetical protein n=1 Tax=Cupriavidus plantarum TaxID=942865 RepID=UPI0015CE3494|nr:hypothetical protein [Cupriavidus plantarum]NYH99600.1 hypothetical protein [Cupriavidus plantarum]
MIRSSVSCAASALLLTGCVTWGQFDQGLDSLVGRPLDDAINVLGMPASERTVAGRRYVQWRRSYSESMPVVSPSTTYGAVQSGRGIANYSATTYSQSYETAEYSCSITLQIGADERVQKSQYEGNLGGCESYIQVLNHFRKTLRK